MLRKRVSCIAAVVACLIPLQRIEAQSTPPAELPSYLPHQVQVPKDATYVLPDGAISIIGNDGWETIMGQFNDLFIKTHPGFKFQTVLKGSSVAIPALETGVSAFAPMGRSMWEGDKTAFREFHNYQPMDIRIGYDGFAPRPGHKNPPGIYVNAKNPLAGLTVEQAARIFTAGSAQGDITHWGQLGLGKAWSNRVIHLYGLRDDGGFATAFRQEFMNKLPFPHNYEPLDRPADVVRAVSEDPYGIGLTGFVDAAAVSNNARLLPMAEHDGDPFVDPTYENVHAGKYPYSFYLHIYINHVPGQLLDPFVKEYVRLILSREGQQILETQKKSEEGYVPLAPRLLATEIERLNTEGDNSERPKKNQ